MKFLFFILFPGLALADCESLYVTRHMGLSKTDEAISCFQKNTGSSDRSTKALALNRISYLKFFKAQFYLETKIPTLLEAIDHAEEGLLLFGRKYDVETYKSLSSIERKLVGELLYHYGLNLSRYVDLAGKFEAIRRMGDIKQSMNSIMRMGEEEVAFFGAHRTMGIFHMKVPAIAGGRIELSKNFLTKAVESTKVGPRLSAYPSNNVSLSDLYYKLNQKEDSCEELRVVADLDPSEVKALNNGYYLESLEAVKEAMASFAERGCR